jgi:hypothetical protein
LQCSRPNIIPLYHTMIGHFLTFVPHVLEAWGTWHASPRIAWPKLWKSAGLGYHVQNISERFWIKGQDQSIPVIFTCNSGHQPLFWHARIALGDHPTEQRMTFFSIPHLANLSSFLLLLGGNDGSRHASVFTAGCLIHVMDSSNARPALS